jgi:hypothetical protein
MNEIIIFMYNDFNILILKIKINKNNVIAIATWCYVLPFASCPRWLNFIIVAW